MMATKTKTQQRMNVVPDTDGMITTDLNEYLMRRSHVNYKDRFYPKEETDLMSTSAKKMQDLVAIEEKYVENKSGKIEDIGRSYFFDDPNYNNLLGGGNAGDGKNGNEFEPGKEPWRIMAEEEAKNKRGKRNGLNDDLNGDIDGNNGLLGGNLKSIYMTDFTKKRMGKNNLNNGRGFGKVETFGNGDIFKASRKGGKNGSDEDPNKDYYKKMQKYLKQSTTGNTTYRVDYCELSKRKKRPSTVKNLW